MVAARLLQVVQQLEEAGQDVVVERAVLALHRQLGVFLREAPAQQVQVPPEERLELLP